MRRMATRLHIAGALGHAAADRRLEILRLVGECGSISEAARRAGVSYKAAWQALDMLSNLAGVPLVERAVGGPGGGGARLAPGGAQLLRAAAEMARSREQALARLSVRKALPSLAALGLRTSMRNQLPCSVVAAEVQGPLARVSLGLAGGPTLVSRITAESAELLALVPGQAVLALFKATAVKVERGATPPRTRTGVNQLPGRVTRVSRSEAADEVAVRIEGGAGLVGFAPGASGLRTGSAVVLSFDENAVVIALP